MDLISIIVPVYNVEQYLLRCVDSIRRQTYENIEIILVDDGSPDRCPELCDEIKNQDARVKVIHKENGGLGFARNSGLDVATGTYVTFVDSDDWISQDPIESLYREAMRTNADAVIASHTRVTSTGKEYLSSLKVKEQVYNKNEMREKIILPLIGAAVDYPDDIELQCSSCMNLYRSSLINDSYIRFPSEKVAISEDMFFNVDFFYHARRIVVLNEVGYFYFENLASISQKYDTGRLNRTVRFYEVMQQRLEKYGLKDVAGLRLNRTFLLDIRVLLRMIVLADMTRKEKYREIQCVLEHELVKKVIASYPIDCYIPAMRLLAKQIRSGNVKAIYWLIQVRQYAKGSSVLKAFLRRFGIGK